MKTGRKKYSRYSEVEREHHVRAQAASSLSVKAYCMRHDIKVGTFYTMRRRSSSMSAPAPMKLVKESRGSFIELTGMTSAGADSRVHLTVNGHELSFSPEVLPSVLAALREV